jgi:FkbM family methyltransferase
MLKRSVKQLLSRGGFSVSNLRLIPPALLKPENLLEVNFDLIVSQHLLKTTDFFFLQIGAFDGVECDPLRNYVQQYRWRGLLLEPQRSAFRELQKNYSDQPQLILRNLAISDKRVRKTLYTVNGGDAPEWCRGLASFRRDVILKHSTLLPDLERRLNSEEVECVTFNDLLDEYQIEKIDLLQIDVEGYDAELIKMFPFDRMKPRIVHFERKHLLRDELDSCLHLLASHKYRFANDGAEDLVAYRAC